MFSYYRTCSLATQSVFKNARTGQETRYTYDLARMMQTNTKTSFQRHIRRMPPPPAPTWQFMEHQAHILKCALCSAFVQ